MQTDDVAAPVAAEYCPAAQLAQLEAAADRANVPAAQLVQAVAAYPEYMPSEQTPVHDVAAAVFEYWPGAQL